MPDTNKRKNVIQDVRNTGDEAARLLAELENSSAESTNSLKPRHSRSEFHRKVEFYEHTRSTSTPKTYPAPALVIGFLLILAAFTGIVQSINSSNSNNASTSTPVEEKKKVMDSDQKHFYNKTLRQANDAVLIREHKAAIINLEKLLRGKYKELSDIDDSLVRDKIIEAGSKIKFLDQAGEHKYWETDDYGAQWFDKDSSSQFKIFLAYSKTCKSPVATFGFMDESEGVIRDRHIVRPTSNLSTIYIPLKLSGMQWITLEKFQCNS